MKPLKCDSCHTKFGPTERYVGIKRPNGLHLICLGCFKKNGGNPKHIKTRMKGDANSYLNNPKTRDELYQLREEFAPKYKEFIKGHKVIRKTYLTPEQVQKAWDTPENVGGGWHLMSKFDFEEVAHDSAMAYELSGYRATVVPTKRIMSGTSVGGIASSKTFRERETMWAVMIYDPQRDIVSTKPEPFTEEWKSAPYEEGTFETLHKGYPRPRGLYMFRANPGIHVGWGPLIIGPRQLNGISPGLLFKLQELFNDPTRQVVRYGDYYLDFVGNGIKITDPNIPDDSILIIYEAKARIDEILERMNEAKAATGKYTWFVRPLYHKVYMQDEPANTEIRETQNLWIIERYKNGTAVGIISLRNKYIPFVERSGTKVYGTPHITWTGAVTELMHTKDVKITPALEASRKKRRGMTKGLRGVGKVPREKTKTEIIPLMDEPELPAGELPFLLEQMKEKEKKVKEQSKTDMVPLI